MKTLKAIYNRYSNAILHALQPLGMFGVFALAFIDSAAIGMPLDPVVAWYVYNDKLHFWAHVLLAASGFGADGNYRIDNGVVSGLPTHLDQVAW